MSYLVLKDSREQKGWNFVVNDNCLGTEISTLPTGDYTIKGYESILCIERKGSTAEIAKNLLEKRFHAELERMESFAHPFVVCEFTLDDILNFPRGSGIPPKEWSKLRVSPFFLLKKIVEMQFQYKSKIIFAGSNGQNIVSSIFKRMLEYAGKQDQTRTRTPEEVDQSGVSKPRLRRSRSRQTKSTHTDK